jgi:metal-responsive CopG/Arc/MetJ family transcriptional regulator
MGTTSKVTITLKKETIERLNKFVQTHSINKSGLIDRLINEEITKKEDYEKLY